MLQKPEVYGKQLDKRRVWISIRVPEDVIWNVSPAYDD